MKGNPMKPIQARKRTGVRQFSVRETRCPKTRTTRSQRSVPGRYQQPQQLWTFGWYVMNASLLSLSLYFSLFNTSCLVTSVASTRSPGMGFPVDTSDHPRLFTGDLKRQCWEKVRDARMNATQSYRLELTGLDSEQSTRDSFAS